MENLIEPCYERMDVYIYILRVGEVLKPICRWCSSFPIQI